MLSGREASERGQATGRAWKGGVFSPSDGTADPAKAAPAVAAALMKLGGSVHQNCAARGIELEGGRVSGVVTEAGTIKTRTAVLAGGAWASSFCNQLGVRFPLATVRQSIVRVSPLEQRLPDALAGPRVAVTRRPDGSYMLAISGRGRVDPTPQLMRFAPQFLPMFAKRWRNVFPGGLEGIRWGHETRARWKLDAPTPMERARILDPEARPGGCARNPPPCRRLVACTAQSPHRQHLGGLHRQHARRRAGDRRSAGGARIHPGRGLFRATASASVPAQAT